MPLRSTPDETWRASQLRMACDFDRGKCRPSHGVEFMLISWCVAMDATELLNKDTYTGRGRFRKLDEDDQFHETPVQNQLEKRDRQGDIWHDVQK
jgi:hypothetical protein